MRQIAREEMSWLSNLMSTNPKGLNWLFQVFLVSSNLFRFCNRDFPVYNYPGMSHAVTGSGKMKIWFTLQAVKGMTRRQERRSNWRAMCTVYCREGTALWPFLTPFVKLRSRSQVRSRSGPRSGPKGPTTKDQRPGPGLTLNLVCVPLGAASSLQPEGGECADGFQSTLPDSSSHKTLSFFILTLSQVNQANFSDHSKTWKTF